MISCVLLGNGENIPFAIAWVPSETGENLKWCLEILINAGLDLTVFTFFADRGKFCNAAGLILNDFGVLINLKFCLEHIFRNIVANFSIEKEDTKQLRSLLHKLQCSTKVQNYAVAAMLIKVSFGEVVTEYIL